MPFAALLRAAEQLQQRGERKRGAEAVQLFSEAVSKYREALAVASAGPAPPADAHAACLFGCAESLQEGAEAVVAACAQLPDALLSSAAVERADAQACSLLQEAVATFQLVLEGGQTRVDALVCAGNALSSWAELAAKREAAAALPLLQRAVECYTAALQREEDALTLSNLADALVQHASLCCEAGRGAQGEQLFGQAMQAYHRACALSDAADGDDVPGLLLNWSRGLLAAAQAAGGPPAALPLLAEAEQRLGRAVDFARGSEEPLLALGDVLLERGEQQAAAGDGAAAADSLRRALDRGYHAAQHIAARSPEAAVGVADVHLQLARLAAEADGGAAQRHWSAAEAAYAAALQQPTAFDFAGRCDVRYNHACCLARLGRRDEASALLRALMAVGGAAAGDAARDADLAGVAI